MYADWEQASIRLDVLPKDAQVYVDRYYAGIVDDFDGIFQRLTLRPAAHLIEMRKSGFKTLVVEVSLYPGESITYRRTMEFSAEPESAPPFAPGFEEGATTPAPDSNAASADVRFDVTPKGAAGIVADFDRTQHLVLAPGRRHLSISLDGYESVDVELSIDTGRTLTYRASLKKVD